MRTSRATLCTPFSAMREPASCTGSAAAVDAAGCAWEASEEDELAETRIVAHEAASLRVPRSQRAIATRALGTPPSQRAQGQLEARDSAARLDELRATE